MALDRKWVFGIVGLALAAVALTGVGLFFTMSSRVEPGHAPGAMPTGAMEPAGAMPPAGGMPPAGATPPAGAANAAPKAAPVSSIEVAAERLEKRLNSSDGSADDWALLARSYVMMKRYPEAADAFSKALKKAPGNKAFIDEQAAAKKAALGDAPSK